MPNRIEAAQESENSNSGEESVFQNEVDTFRRAAGAYGNKLAEQMADAKNNWQSTVGEALVAGAIGVGLGALSRMPGVIGLSVRIVEAVGAGSVLMAGAKQFGEALGAGAMAGSDAERNAAAQKIANDLAFDTRHALIGCTGIGLGYLGGRGISGAFLNAEPIGLSKIPELRLAAGIADDGTAIGSAGSPANRIPPELSANTTGHSSLKTELSRASLQRHTHAKSGTVPDLQVSGALSDSNLPGSGRFMAAIEKDTGFINIKHRNESFQIPADVSGVVRDRLWRLDHAWEWSADGRSLQTTANSRITARHWESLKDTYTNPVLLQRLREESSS